MKELFHREAGDIFHNRGQNRSPEKGQNRIPAAAVETEQNHQRPMAVNRTDRPVQESPLFAEPPLPDGAVDHLAAPAQHTVNHEEQKDITAARQVRCAD